ncbi:MAG: hypothetical protein E6J90_00885 [Deltaproteobacteria bacterium]|nr:MAG: hypothetical protein E6J90_00885 [Deltaproteobacteria bacterium]
MIGHYIGGMRVGKNAAVEDVAGENLVGLDAASAASSSRSCMTSPDARMLAGGARPRTDQLTITFIDGDRRGGARRTGSRVAGRSPPMIRFGVDAQEVERVAIEPSNVGGDLCVTAPSAGRPDDADRIDVPGSTLGVELPGHRPLDR